MLAEASQRGWEGVIANRGDAHCSLANSARTDVYAMSDRRAAALRGARCATFLPGSQHFDAETCHSPSPSRAMRQHTESTHGSESKSSVRSGPRTESCVNRSYLAFATNKNARAVHRECESLPHRAHEVGDMNTRTSDSGRRSRPGRATAKPRRRSPASSSDTVIRQLEEIEAAGGSGTLGFGRGKTLRVSSLDKVYFPELGITKGELMRYYTAMAPAILPAIKDRPLVLKRYPEGIGGASFFQHNAGDAVPEHVRTAQVTTESGQPAERIVGGDLPTLLYTVQIGAIAVHAWQARIGHLELADTSTIDLDPGEDVPFREVVVLAVKIREQLAALELQAGIKTSGSSGLHIVLPLPTGTTFAESSALATAISRRVAQAHPKRATLERSIKNRPAGTIYVDAQQNAEGKSVVAAYSVRARAKATVSTPIAWTDLRSGLRLEQFTVETMPIRFRRIGDIWSAAMKRRNSRRALEALLGGL